MPVGRRIGIVHVVEVNATGACCAATAFALALDAGAADNPLTRRRWPVKSEQAAADGLLATASRLRENNVTRASEVFQAVFAATTTLATPVAGAKGLADLQHDAPRRDSAAHGAASGHRLPAHVALVAGA